MLKRFEIYPIMIINSILLLLVLIIAICLIEQRFNSRLNNNQLAILHKNASNLDKEYTRLEIEFATYSSKLVLYELAHHKLQLIKPTEDKIIELTPPPNN